MLRIDTPAGPYAAALDVDTPSGIGVSYRVVDDLTTAEIPVVAALPNGGRVGHRVAGEVQHPVPAHRGRRPARLSSYSPGSKAGVFDQRIAEPRAATR